VAKVLLSRSYEIGVLANPKTGVLNQEDEQTPLLNPLHTEALQFLQQPPELIA
jgi:hypothetical protein